MNRKQRKEKLTKLAQQQVVDNIIKREVDAMNSSDVNDAGGESPEAWAERIALEIMNSKPMPGVDDPE